ncbi:AAA family ATPase [Candidatus Gottesmanbacteria bacterium]|nr:AAA family ATPase [Candidatus Gottesmanbacteria bacterium]
MTSCILVLAGLPGSGKSFAADFFLEKGIPVVQMGKVTQEELKKRGLSQSPQHEAKIRIMLRKQYGLAIYAKRVLPIIKDFLKTHRIVIVDGVRSKFETDFFKTHLPHVVILYLEADEQIRYKRLKERKSRSHSYTEARERDSYEWSQLGLETIKLNADFVIKNVFDKARFRSNLNDIYRIVQTWMEQ